VAVLAVAAGQEPRSDTSAAVVAGADVLVESGFEAVRGRRVGLITNHTGRTSDGRSLADVLATTKACELVALYSPEHGFDGRLDAKVADAVHGSGRKIWSLYGETRQPTAEMLAGVDCLVFDIQDVGARFYTYVSTMGLAMIAAAEHGARFVVLDRPNPIGGLAVEGPVLDAGKESFTGFWRIPVRHGMTVGELARLFAREHPKLGDKKLDLVVVEARGWRRSMLFDATGLAWVNPSPNMRDLHAALLYPGVGLLETTNLSVGRGTDDPFERVGAPWIDGQKLARQLNAQALPGLRCYPIEFTPSSSKFAGERCGGVFLVVTDRERFDSVRAGLHLACALRDLFADQWRMTAFGRLLDDDAALAALARGERPDAIAALWSEELAEFRQRRASVLLYE
jgi:uncharacterized protein YbbC (DUF1343 family)